MGKRYLLSKYTSSPDRQPLLPHLVQVVPPLPVLFHGDVRLVRGEPTQIQGVGGRLAQAAGLAHSEELLQAEGVSQAGDGLTHLQDTVLIRDT